MLLSWKLPWFLLSEWGHCATPDPFSGVSLFIFPTSPATVNTLLAGMFPLLVFLPALHIHIPDTQLPHLSYLLPGLPLAGFSFLSST